MSAREALPPKRPAPGLRWWGGFVNDPALGRARLVLRWPRLAAVAGVLALTLWLAGATALWGFYHFRQHIPSVRWSDVALLRFPRVQEAIGAYYFGEAKSAAEKKEIARALMLARAAVRKSPANLEARLFFAALWTQVRRPEEAARVLRDGLARHAAEPRWTRALVEAEMASGHHAALLKLLREELPARGQRPLAGSDPLFRIAELRAVLETAGAEEADRLAAQSPALADEPLAAPLLARIDFDRGRGGEGHRRVVAARDRRPELPELHEAVIDAANKLGRNDLAREAADAFYAKFPDSATAHLRFLETRDPAKTADETRWMTECLRFLVRYRQTPAVLERLADLAARRGWSDLTFLLYQNSLQETLSSYPFGLHYVGSLARKGDYAAAERVLQQLAAEKDSSYVAAAPVVAYLSAMVEWGLGREAEAQRHLDRLKLEVAGDDRRLKGFAQIFRTLGFAPLADRLLGTAGTPVAALAPGA